MPTKTYFITGANRGIGKELVKQLLTNPENRVIATCRRTDAIPELQVTKNPNLVILRLDYSDTNTLINLATELERLQWAIDVFIANAALNTAKHGVLDSSPEEYQQFFKVNTIGPIETLKVLKPFMMKSNTRKVILKSSILGSINGFPDVLAQAYPCAPYSVSKASLNMITKLLSYELAKDGFVVVSYHPGMINTKAKETNDDISAKPDFKPDVNFIKIVSREALSIEDGVKKELDIINGLTKEDSGKFLSHTGEEIDF